MRWLPFALLLVGCGMTDRAIHRECVEAGLRPGTDAFKLCQVTKEEAVMQDIKRKD